MQKKKEINSDFIYLREVFKMVSSERLAFGKYVERINIAFFVGLSWCSQ